MCLEPRAEVRKIRQYGSKWAFSTDMTHLVHIFKDGHYHEPFLFWSYMQQGRLKLSLSHFEAHFLMLYNVPPRSSTGILEFTSVEGRNKLFPK